jgi:hypothetical protein
VEAEGFDGQKTWMMIAETSYSTQPARAPLHLPVLHFGEYRLLQCKTDQGTN